ncbi:hypothetical protein HN954_04690 [bacterium]|jgi:hypothetical protein|nr:hypothetical protein [bacterium]MBT6832122.1 hypothetical protein [bacterium]MBT6996696.1 hypothetical protein [bacterium]MBT7772336.1 hypothetical protein [bacterium]
MKKILWLSLPLFFVGCSAPALPGSAENIKSEQIQIGENTWQFDLPKSWEIVPAPSSVNAAFFARNGSENIVMTHEIGSGESLINELINSAADGFYSFEEVARGTDFFQFRAKISVTEPQRDFWQKIAPAPGTDLFLFASCSIETATGTSGDCETMMNSLELLVDSEKKNK